jgi:hypothetical protein
MLDWVEEAVLKIKNRREMREMEHEREVRKAQMVTTGCEAAFNSFAAAVERDLKKFNESFQNDPESKIDSYERPSADSVVVRKTSFPSFRINIELNRNQKTIEYTGFAAAKKEYENNESRMSGQFHVKVEADGTFYLIRQKGRVTPEQASRALLEPFVLML